MPFKLLTACSHPGCPRLTRERYCEQCSILHPAWEKRKPYEHKRTTGHKLQRERERLFSEQPLCVECMKEGRTTAATIRDHIIPMAEGGTDTGDNVQGLCVACHDIKTIEEGKRGKGCLMPIQR